MPHITPSPRRLRAAPAQNLARAAITRLLAEGRCVIGEAQLAEIANISVTTARTFLNAGTATGLFQNLADRIPVAHTSHYVVTEKFPGAPSAETISMSALMHVATGKGPVGSAAFAYHTALALHGLSEVTPEGLHVIKIRDSIHPPALPSSTIYIPKDRPPREWMRLINKQPVWLTLRSASQIPTIDVMTITREQMPIPVTSELRTLVDAWMHPDWCGGTDRVADSWQIYWKNQSGGAKRAQLATLLVSTTWPGLWQPLVQWATTAVPALEGLLDMVQKAATKG